MNRRGFIKALAAVPLAAVCVNNDALSASTPVKPPVMAQKEAIKFERIDPMDIYVDPRAKYQEAMSAMMRERIDRQIFEKYYGGTQWATISRVQ